MTFIADNWMLISIAVTSGLLLLWPSLQGFAAPGLSVNDAVFKMNREKAVVIDVSSSEEFALGHIGSSHNLPTDQLEIQLPQVVKHKTTPLLLVCATGQRAQKAALNAKKLGYEQVFCLQGGLKAWRDANMPTEKS
ncbi:MAG: rhodanese-like domain-containing protein [Betaproteobacteria bacterium]|nr:rhodanese-like domain-containing protein [Betaproteobacteria bacterium]NBY04413.1 rhodanese-like domain-containing protein [Betaproteobacteria bacterium]